MLAVLSLAGSRLESDHLHCLTSKETARCPVHFLSLVVEACREEEELPILCQLHGKLGDLERG